MFVQYILPILIFATIAGLIAWALCLASIKFAVKEDPLFEQVKSIIGDTNCGGCGYAGCAGYTKALVTFEDNLGKCRPMKQDAYNQIDAILKQAKSTQNANLHKSTSTQPTTK
ncbi:MAG: hypothetical protein LBK70_02490 [Clostridiales bacterium]|jgi:RnfABCDGE-type electron transport complex B subunit|nr:hypothetical protein [Clostridiales bacterium]